MHSNIQYFPVYGRVVTATLCEDSSYELRIETGQLVRTRHPSVLRNLLSETLGGTYAMDGDGNESFLREGEVPR